MARNNKSIALFGGSFNPPGLHHIDIVRRLAAQFDIVKVVPCGPRPDKKTTNDIAPIHRAAMVDLAFGNIAPNVEVELFDLENGTYTPNCELEARYRTEGDVWHVVGMDIVEGGARGASQIHTVWRNGRHMWDTARFCVVLRDGYDLRDGSLPRNTRTIIPAFSGSSSEIRDRCFHRYSYRELVTEPLAEYIERHNLYRGGKEADNTTACFPEPRIHLVVDRRNDRALRVQEKLQHLHSEDDFALVVVAGGDGTMLHAIQKLWRQRKPFFGINTGHRGFLLNNVAREVSEDFLTQEFHALFSPLLYVEAIDSEGRRTPALAFNDAAMLAELGKTGWFEVAVNGEIYQKRMRGDGVLVATAAGSSAYARAMGANPLPLGTKLLVVVGSNVDSPARWDRGANIPLEALVTFRNADVTRWRKTYAFADGKDLGEAAGLHVRTSRIAAAELLFTPDHDVRRKLLQAQFPRSD